MKKTLIISSLALALSAPAFANDHGDHMSIDQKYAKYDTNKDGFLSEAEFAKKMDDHDKSAEADVKFAEIDDNSDGKISKAEMQDWKNDKDDDDM